MSKSACVNLVLCGTYPAHMVSRGMVFSLTNINSMLEKADCGISSI